MKRDQNNLPGYKENMEDDYTSMDIASSTECTGMMYKPPVTDEDVEGYQDIYSVPQQKDINAQKTSTPKQQEKISSVRKGRK